MTKIRTAEEILSDPYYSPEGGWEEGHDTRLIKAMQEYAKQFINLAAEEAQARMRYIRMHSNGYPEVDKESILKLKERVV